MKRRFYIGPGAASLLLVIVVVIMTILGMLALMSARGDERLMERSRDFVAAEYDTAAQAERSLAELDGIAAECAGLVQDDAEFIELMAQRLPEGMALEGRLVRWLEAADEGRALSCAVRVAELGTYPRLAWEEHIFTADGDEEYS